MGSVTYVRHSVSARTQRFPLSSSVLQQKRLLLPGADDNTIRHINDLVKSLERDHEDIMDDMTAKSNTLQTALVASQGVQEGIDGLLVWLRDAESALSNMRPISLSEDSLNEQAKEYQVRGAVTPSS